MNVEEPKRRDVVPAPTIEMFAPLEADEIIEDRVATGNYLNKSLHIYRDESGAVITEEVDVDDNSRTP